MARKSTRPTQFNLCLFGAFRLEPRGGDAIRLPRRKVELLLAYLALNPGAHAREKLAALFWGDTPDTQARQSLRTALATLRKTLGDAALIADRDAIQLNPDFPLWVDTREFSQTRAALPEHAIELYRGDLLPDCYDDWLAAVREHLRAQSIETLAYLAQQYRAQSEYERAMAYAQKILATDPANETAFQHLMFCEMARGNRPAALAQYAACVRALRDELAVEPSPETQKLFHWIKQTAHATPDAARITNLPIPPTSFIGRKAELAQIKSALAETRLLTLTGAGGNGKTRLAIQVAIDLLNTFRDGVWWSELASVTDPALVPHVVAKSLGIGEKSQEALAETIVDSLRGKNVLLILDNCEHLIAACAQIADALLRECPHLKILATSREPLAIAGEQVWQVPTLSVPTALPTREQLMLTYESIRLFVERARAINPGFDLTEDNLLAVLQICRRLDGIPLAIELAAARIVALSAQEIAARLDDRFNLLTHGSRTALPRQQTLRALVDWSYDLLSDAERVLLQRLTVFSGGRTLDAIEQVCAFDGIAPSQVLDLVTRLVAKSLLIIDRAASGGETRYAFLDTIKYYAREKFLDARETRARHLAYFLDFAERAHRELQRARQVEWLERLEREHTNLRVALRFALEQNESALALRLCNALTDFWDVRGYLGEGREWLRRALAASQATPARAAYAWAQINAGELASKQGDYTVATALTDAGLACVRALGDQAGIATALGVRGTLARMQSDWPAAQTWFDEALAIARALQDARLIGNALRNLGIVAEAQGRYAEARRAYEESLRLNQEMDDPRATALTLSNLGNLAQQQGEYARARELYEQILAIHRAMGARWSVAATLTNLGNLAHSQTDYAAARDYHQAGLKLMREIGDKRGIAIVLNNLANATLAQNDFPAARKLHEEGLRLRRELNDQRGIAIVLGNLGDVAAGSREFPQAQQFYAEALTGLRELGDKRTIANCLIGAAEVAAELDQPARAAQLAGGIHTILATLDAQIDTRERARYDHARQRARAQIDPSTFGAAWRDGLALTLEQTIELALN
jgi:predicted ATPase/DNA-binding SARP family transcriptional activator